MAVVAGIDEAGLGPLLGPLTMGVAAFRVPEQRVGTDLWRELAPAVSATRPKDERLWVADSKQVYDRSARGMARLESTALAFLAQLDLFGRPPAAPGALLAAGPGSFPSDQERLADHPWYDCLPASLPVASAPSLLQRQSERLREVLDRQGIHLVQAGLRLIPAAQLNDSFDATLSKSRTAWDQVARALRGLWEAHGEEGILSWVDRQGARKRYAGLISELFPEASVRILEETAQICSYRVHNSTQRMELHFAVRAEDHALPVALASCFAKYGRELSMQAFNSYFEALAPELELRPTAGYVVDARRWLEDAGPVLKRAALPPRCLVRER
ncbi:MAG: ribonuclease HII [Planctomycetota bacterium]|jgi:ribonuclease HII